MRAAGGGVAMRKAVGLAMQARLMEYTPRLGPAVIGVVDEWYSTAVLVPPIGINVTADSYAGTLSIGLLTEPSLHSDPRQLLDDMRHCLAEIMSSAANTAKTKLGVMQDPGPG